MENITLPKDENPYSGLIIKDNSKRARIVLIIFVIVIGLDLIGVFSGYLELQLLEAADNGEFITDAEAEASDNRQAVIGILQTIVLITSMVVFLNWFRRAYANLHRIGINYLKHEESWALWFWFIPILSLFRPVQIMNEIWNETQEKIKTFDPSYNIKKGGLLIGFWWALFIFSNYVGRYVMKTAFKTDTLEQIIEGSQAMLISDLLQIPEALLVIAIVMQLSKMESKLAFEFKKSGGTVI